MGWVRYVLAIAVGLAVGMAVGWYSGRVDSSQPHAAGHHHHRHHHGRSQSVDVHPSKHSPDHSSPPAPKPTSPAHVPTVRELQQQMLDCVMNHPYAAGQAACLRGVLRGLGASPDLWGGGSGGDGPSLPFALLGQD